MDASSSNRRPRAAAAAAAVLALVACINRFRTDAPVQGWYAALGPVVPHDTFPGDCSLCHVGDGWTGIRTDFSFDHAAETGVALEGAHAAARCLRCHNDRGPVALFAARGCAGCHADVHRGTLGGDCGACHDVVSWRPGEVYAIHARTRFPLIGAHASAACWRCHPGGQVGNFLPVSAECIACHASDLALAQDPDHLAQGWVDDCQDCHVPTTWDGAGFTHAAWPLTGAHAAAACVQCHAGGVFAGTPSECVDCHLADYQSARDPDHAGLGIPLDCALCHGTAGWEGAAFDHAGIASSCADCHLDDYLATRDPNHQAAGFPTSCETCHFSTTDWEDAEFQHTFKITSGDHASLACADCHLVPVVFTDPSCIHCHEHSFREMQDEHDDVRGFVWSNPACIQCHPTGEE